MDDIRSFCPLWGEWEADEKLGEGSFGAVWKMRRQGFGGQAYYAAVKHISIPKDESEIRNLMDEGILDSRESAVRYYDRMLNSLMVEIDTMHQLQGYTNIVSYEDHKIIRKASGIGYDLFLRMELLTPLTKRIREQMTASDVIRLGCDIAEAISILNKFHMVHRDIKPQNIFVNNTGDCKLGDYGTARALHSEATAMSRKGTFNYMAPEIYNNQAADIRVDIYSLGIVLYRLLNGNRLPFLPAAGEITSQMNEEAQIRRLSGEPLPPPHFASGNLARVVLKACAFRPQDRYQSAEELKRDLLLCLEERKQAIHENSLEQNPSDPLPFRFTRTNTGSDSPGNASSGGGMGRPGQGERSPSGKMRPEEPSDHRPASGMNNMPPVQQSAPEKKKFGIRGAALLVALLAVVMGVVLLVNGLRKSGGENKAVQAGTAPAAADITGAADKAPDPDNAETASAANADSASREETEPLPTEIPTEIPTEVPTEIPTEIPTQIPTEVPTEVPTEAPTAVPKPQGDVNGDGVLDAGDADLLGRFVAGWDVKLDREKADVNGDGTVDLSDVVRLLKNLQNRE